MIVSRGRRFIFIHIPKTGGTALTLALEARAMKDDIVVGDTPKAQKRRHRLAGIETAGRLWKHSTLADLAGLVTPGEIEGFFVFTLVRNPWDRLVSYYHWLREQRFDHPAVAIAAVTDFSGFLNHAHTAASIGQMPYAAYMRAPDGRERCDLFARIEAVEEDLAPFEAHAGLRLGPIARANVSERARDWRPYYSEADAALVGRLCAADIGRFGYRFDP